MWLIPKSSRFSHFAPATVDSNSDYPAHWRTLCESLQWRSKHTHWRTWSQRLRKASWLSKLCGRICEPSRQKDFEDALISSLRATRASRSVPPASEKAKATTDTFGRILRESCGQLNLFGASSRTSPATCPLDSPQFTEAYEIWVTKLRQDCLQRQSAVRRTDGSDCLFWPTMSVYGQHNYKGVSEKSGDGLATAVKNWPTPNVPNRGPELSKKHRPKSGGIDLQSSVALWPTPATAEAGKISNQPNYGQVALSNHPAIRGTPRRPPLRKDRKGQPKADGLRRQDSPSMNGKSQELWGTPQASDTIEGKRTDPTSNQKCLNRDLKQMAIKGKLNPDWVEQLMGLAVGWTDLGFWGTE